MNAGDVETLRLHRRRSNPSIQAKSTASPPQVVAPSMSLAVQPGVGEGAHRRLGGVGAFVETRVAPDVGVADADDRNLAARTHAATAGLKTGIT